MYMIQNTWIQINISCKDDKGKCVKLLIWDIYMNKQIRILFSLVTLFLLVSYAGVAFSQEIVVYSARKEHLIKPVFLIYTKRIKKPEKLSRYQT